MGALPAPGRALARGHLDNGRRHRSIPEPASPHRRRLV